MILVELRTGALTKKCGWEGERVALSPLAGPAAMSAGLALSSPRHVNTKTGSHRNEQQSNERTLHDMPACDAVLNSV